MSKLLIPLVYLLMSVKVVAFPIDFDNLVLIKPETVGMSSSELLKLDDVVRKHITDDTIQGAVLAVSRHGKPVHFQAYGISDISKGSPMRKDSMFHMMSSTKPVLGVAAMIAVERGFFSPQDEVQKYIPSFKDMKVAVLQGRDSSPKLVWADTDKEPGFFARMAGEMIGRFTGSYMMHVPEYTAVSADRPVTIHDLLTHTAGVGTYGLGTAVSGLGAVMGNKTEFVNRDHTLETFVDFVAEALLDFQPGTRWMYSGTIGLDVVARIIEVTSGQPFNVFVQENIFNPLDMRDTHWWNDSPVEKQSRLVVRPDSGVKDKGKKFDAATTKKARESRYYSGSVGLVSTARDYLHFEQMLVNRGQLLGNRVLKESSVELMSTNQVGDLFGKNGKGKLGGEGFGYTVSVTLDPDAAMMPRSKGAFGWAGALGTISWTEPKTQLAVVLMVQQPTKNFPYEIAKVLSDAIID